jgi:predicted DsbA family dithiol-disulfide isomerase
MKLTVLVVPDCPHAALMEARLGSALVGRHDVQVTWRVVGDEAQAAETGLRGSPTLLIDGKDPFAEPDQPASLSCRLYRDHTGRVDGAPSVAALRNALEHAAR